MTHSFPWILQIPSSPLWVLYSGVPWVSAGLPAMPHPSLEGHPCPCLSMWCPVSNTGSRSEGAGESLCVYVKVFIGTGRVAGQAFAPC